jgi:hypothetical protein
MSKKSSFALIVVVLLIGAVVWIAGGWLWRGLLAIHGKH